MPRRLVVFAVLLLATTTAPPNASAPKGNEVRVKQRVPKK